MNNLRRFEFFSKERRDPYIQDLIEFKVSETEGFIHFDGYYYVMNEELPALFSLADALVLPHRL